MDGAGLIRDKLDIKILILFILARLPDAECGDTLYDLVCAGETIGYFDYTQALAELVETDHIQEEDGTYRITDKGHKNGATIESSLPYSVRVKAERRALERAAVMRRSASIKTSHTTDDKGCSVELAMSDGMGEIINIRALCGGEAQALAIEKNFRKNAERVFNSIMEILSGEKE